MKIESASKKQDKIFQPKIIIGSIFGLITSIVGFIAVFFPNLFNLEKEIISDNFEIELANEEHFYKLLEYIQKFIPEDEKPKIFRFTAYVCDDDSSPINIEIDNNHKHKVYYKIHLAGDPAQIISIEGEPASHTHRRHYEIGEWCKGLEGNGGEVVGGYFLYVDAQYRGFFEAVNLKSIPLEQIRLKNY